MEKEFDAGDRVYLKLQHYRQKSVQDRKNQKLARRFFGPCKIVKSIGKVAYKLELPPASKVHPIFHVSLLKESHGNIPKSTCTLDPFTAEDNCEMLPEAMLDRRNRPENQQQLLIKWDKRPLEETTWEDKGSIQEQYPCFPDIEDNVFSPGGDDDMNQAGPSTTQAQLQPNMEERPKRQIRKPNKFIN
ncbi:uncharacterized protein LOC143607319 [Bidens hawaiensis]|uniref:uncharacterized protein LOC143607319 n=1 Tax=Bidens hawaiensis TaxID=980011 RepID=UPI00404A085E